MPPEDSDSVRFSRKMDYSTTSVKAIAMTTLLIGCLGTQPWSVTGNNDIHPWDMLHMHFSNQYQGCHKPVTGKIQASPSKTTLVVLHKLFMDTKKLLPWAGANPGFGDEGRNLWWVWSASLYWGSWGVAPVVFSDKAPGEVRGLCPLELTNYQQLRH